MVVLEHHNGDEHNAKKHFKSYRSRESTSVTRLRQRGSREHDGRNAMTSLYSGPVALTPYVSRQCQTNPLALLTVPNRSNVSNFVRDPRVSMSPVSQYATNQIIYPIPAAQPDGPEPFKALFSQLTLGSPNEYGDNSIARSCQEHRRNESTSSSATSRSERKGPIIAKTPEAV